MSVNPAIPQFTIPESLNFQLTSVLQVMRLAIVDGPVKSRKSLFFVIPVKTGIQVFQLVTDHLDSGACPGPDPGFTGVTTFYRGIIVELDY